MEFVIDVHAFAFRQGVQAELAVPTTLVRQRHPTRRQQLVLVVRRFLLSCNTLRESPAGRRRGARRCRPSPESPRPPPL